MDWCGGLFSVSLKTTDVRAIERFCEALQFFKMAVSWGGHESLVLPACAFHKTTETNIAPRHRYPINLVRFYVGLESAEDLIADLKQALMLLV